MDTGTIIMADLNYTQKCFVQHFNLSFFNKTFYFLNITNTNYSLSTEGTEAAGFGTVTGVLVAVFINLVLSLEYDKLGEPVVKLKVNELVSAKTMSRTLAIMILFTVTPLVFSLLFLAILYKVVCSIIIRRTDKRFVKFLDSFDVFWSLEDDTSKSIINVLGVIQSDSPQALVDDIKRKLIKVLENAEADKIFYRRKENYGFFYWRKYSKVDMDQYVQIIDQTGASELKVSDLEDIMANVSEKSLPYLDEGLFQILVTRQRLVAYGEVKGEYGIIFRIHHSVGDGVALIDFLCKTLADEKGVNLINMFCNSKGFDDMKNNSPSDLVNMIWKLCQILICFVDGILRKPDDSVLHGPTLLGKKVFKWTQSDENLLSKMKQIKDNVKGLRVSDILAAALSNGLHNFFLKAGASIPEKIAVVLPIRFPKASMVDSSLKLENDFSVTILDLPTKIDNLVGIQKACNEFRKSADPITNYYFLKLVCSILPRHILLSLLNSSQATAIFSNMPGPECLRVCGGNLLKKLVFFVPHKGTTGLGVTALCYGGVLRLSVSADEALVSNSDDLDLILEGMVEEVHRLHAAYVVKM